MKVLLVNSDLAKNRGDRAIAEGLIQLIQERYDAPEIMGLSEHADRDTEWFGIRFLNTDTNSLNPFAWIRLAWHASRADIVYWGGGEVLKDYTNKLALWYWAKKIAWLRLFNSNIYGAYQGIGPTGSALSRKLIVFAVNRTRKFVLRDQESVDKLVSWGVDAGKLIAATDPAVLIEPDTLDQSDLELLRSIGIDSPLLDDFIAIAPRNWFHYQQGGFLPHRYRQDTLDTQGQSKNADYRNGVIRVIEEAAKHASNVLLVPMHMFEDVEFCESIAARVADHVSIRVLGQDNISPQLLRRLLAKSKAMIGFRLHSNILATSACVPSINFYYVDKGRIYFDQIGQQDMAFPVETLLGTDSGDTISASLARAISQQAQIRDELRSKIGPLRDQLRTSFQQLHQ